MCTSCRPGWPRSAVCQGDLPWGQMSLSIWCQSHHVPSTQASKPLFCWTCDRASCRICHSVLVVSVHVLRQVLLWLVLWIKIMEAEELFEPDINSLTCCSLEDAFTASVPSCVCSCVCLSVWSDVIHKASGFYFSAEMCSDFCQQLSLSCWREMLTFAFELRVWNPCLEGFCFLEMLIFLLFV